MTEQSDYDDGLVRLDERGITLRRYYFPWAGAKVVPYDEIKAVRVRPTGVRTGAWRIWGSGDFRHWFGLDVHRRSRSQVVDLDVGQWVHPSCTPADPDRMLAILRGRVAAPIEGIDLTSDY